MVAVESVGVSDVSTEENKAKIELYLKTHFKKEKQVYPSDVADALELPYEVVRQVFDDLEREGKIQESR